MILDAAKMKAFILVSSLVLVAHAVPLGQIYSNEILQQGYAHSSDSNTLKWSPSGISKWRKSAPNFASNANVYTFMQHNGNKLKEEKPKGTPVLSFIKTLEDLAKNLDWKLKATFYQEFKKLLTSSTVDCDVCKVGVSLIQTLLKLGESQDEIAKAITDLCEFLKIEDTRVCKGIIPEFKDEFFAIFTQIVLTPAEICGLVFGVGCAQPYDPMVNWTIQLPITPKPPVVPPKPPKTGSPTVRVLQLSDIHFDPQYKEGTNAQCEDPLCCRENSGPVAPGVKPSGKWGDYRNCDTSVRTLEHLFGHLASNETFDYIIWTGDLPPHDVWNQSRSSQLALLQTLHDMFVKFFPKTPVFAALGNHESAPVDSFPPPFVSGKDSISWLYDALAKNWGQWLPNTTVPTIKRGSYYTVLVQPGFRIVSINTNYCNNNNWWLYINMTDPANELAWLVDVLQKAENNKEKVHIIGHIPPGNRCLQAWSWNYYSIINRYESTVVAQFFGHTHADHFELFFDEKDRSRASNIAYIGPSVTTYSGLNPGYRIYEVDGNYDGSSRVVLDHETYIFNLTEINLTDKPAWTKEYSAKATYGMNSLLPNDWNEVVRKFEKDDTLFQKFITYWTKSAPRQGKCEGPCKESTICGLRTARTHDSSFCNMTYEEHTSKKFWHNRELC